MKLLLMIAVPYLIVDPSYARTLTPNDVAYFADTAKSAMSECNNRSYTNDNEQKNCNIEKFSQQQKKFRARYYDIDFPINFDQLVAQKTLELYESNRDAKAPSRQDAIFAIIQGVPLGLLRAFFLMIVVLSLRFIARKIWKACREAVVRS